MVDRTWHLIELSGKSAMVEPPEHFSDLDRFAVGAFPHMAELKVIAGQLASSWLAGHWVSSRRSSGYLRASGGLAIPRR